MHWRQHLFADLSGSDVYAILQLRARVFVVEQQCAFLDPDDIDRQDNVHHLLGKNDNGTLLAYARLMLPESIAETMTVSRVLTAPEWRGHGNGHALMREILHRCRRHQAQGSIRLNAQTRLRHFYARHGFNVCGTPYLEDGIEHIGMECLFSTQAS